MTFTSKTAKNLIILIIGTALILFYNNNGNTNVYRPPKLQHGYMDPVRSLPMSVQNSPKNVTGMDIKQIPLDSSPDVSPNNRVTMDTTCPSVLERMMMGKWRKLNYSSEDEEFTESFNKPLFAKTSLCGVANYNRHEGRSIYAKVSKQLCNPKGKTPCCYENQCVSKGEEECNCPNCYDLRSRIHAETAEWVAEDTRCQVKSFTASSACDLLQGGTLHFYGDSLVRQVFLAMGTILNHTALLAPGLSESQVALCQGPYVIISKCKELIDKTPSVCRGKVKLLYAQIRNMKNVPEMLRTAKPLIGRNKSLIFVGGGLWMDNDVEQTSQFATSLFSMLYNVSDSSGKWPKALWAGLHSADMILHKDTEENDYRRHVFNRHMKTVAEKYRVPIFDTMNITREARSTDGNHYSLGVNLLKAHVLLHYIAQLEHEGIWT